MSIKSENQKSTSVPGWLLPILVTILIGVCSWTLKEVIALKLAVAVQANTQQNAHDAVGDINNVLTTHSKTLADHDARLTRVETTIQLEHK